MRRRMGMHGCGVVILGGALDWMHGMGGRGIPDGLRMAGTIS